MQIIDEFVKGGANTYVVRKMRKTQYKLQKLFLVATYEDKENQEWHMLMPLELTKALSTSLNFYLDMANKGVKPHLPSNSACCSPYVNSSEERNFDDTQAMLSIRFILFYLVLKLNSDE